MEKIFSLVRLLFITFTLVLTISACGGGSSGSKQTTKTSDNYVITLDFQRVIQTGLDSIDVTATIKNNGNNVTNAIPDVSLTRGSFNTPINNSDGSYSFTITPTQTGEHEVTVAYKGAAITRTPLVLFDVHTDWGQPMAVPGYVNTDGYEDGVTVTPDGEYVFVQTGPQYHAGTFVMEVSRANNGCGGAFKRLDPTRCSHTWLDTIPGTYTAPKRPGFFDGRFDGTTLLHNANSWGVGFEQAPNYAISTMFYGFKRQADGSFKEPFYVAFNDENDAIMSPFGLSFYMNGDGTAKTLFTFNDPTDPDMVDFDNNGTDDAESLFDVYHTTITLGQNNNLGGFNYSGTPETHPVRGTTFNSSLVNFGKKGIEGIAGTQGNPHLHAPGGIVKSIWTDDEYDARGAGSDRGDLSVYILDSGDLNTGTWTKVILPTEINAVDPSDEIQPFFTGSGLYFTRSGVVNPEIYYVSYTGAHSQADFSNNANWGTPQKILSMDPSSSTLGRIVAVGEPTIANYKGDEYLYFVYVVFRNIDALPVDGGTGVTDLNFQAGFIKKN